jgi:hypothetical protein
MLTNVAETSRTQQCVTDGVGDCICITVAEQSTLASDAHTGQHQRPIIIGEAMDVETLANSHDY